LLQLIFRLLQCLHCRITIGRCGSSQLRSNIATQLLGQPGQFVGRLLHQRVLSGFFSELLQLIALSLFLFAESLNFVTSCSAEVLLGSGTQLRGFGGIECEFLRQFSQRFQQLAIGLLQGLQSEWSGGTGYFENPRALPGGLRSWNGAFVSGTGAQFEGVALLQPERLQVQSKVTGDSFGTFFEDLCRLNAEGILVAAKVQFQQTDADVIGGDGIERHNVIRSDFESILDSGGLQHGRFVGHCGQTSIGWFAGVKSEFIVSVEFETSATCHRECELGLHSIG
jgi:hypothetical protein